MLPYLELTEETDVGIDQLANVIELVAHACKTIDTEAESKALPLIGIEAAVAQHVGMQHAATS